MSFQVGSVCYPTAEQAAQASASSQIGSFAQQGNASFVINAATSDAASITYLLTPVAGGTGITIVSPYTPQPCGMLTFQDGLEMGWMVAAVWLVTYGVLMMKDAVRGWGDQHGNT